MPKPTNQNEVKFQGFVQLELNADDIASIQKETGNATQIIDQVNIMLKEGYKVSLSYDAGYGSFKANAMDVDTSRTTSGYMLSGSAPTTLEAMAVLVYKHVVMMDKSWLPFCIAPRKAQGYR